MDFFSQQDLARKQTNRLVSLFLLAVLAMVAALNLLAAVLVMYGRDKTINSIELANQHGLSRSLLDPYNWQYAGWVTLAVILVIGVASLFKWISLQGGGQVVAASLGGKLIVPNTNDFHQRRLLNIVEEMAIASGMPVPPVYVMPDSSINAFAAGYQASDAVIGVTHGCMTKLTRDQLQGVIGHEFSHIANGDMRLNIRLMAMLFGILFIALIGRFIMESGAHSSHRSRDKNNGGIFLLGLGLMALGYLGVFCGNLIKAAVSRQREFLADASAVQYTRNPKSIADALKVIGHGSGSHIGSPEREETAHMFFGSAMNFRFRGFATHPPLADRIRRIEPRWDGRYLPPQTLEQAQQESPELVSDKRSAAIEALVTTAAVSDALASAVVETKTTIEENPQLQDQQILLDMAHEPLSAQTLILCMLLAPSERFVHQQQLDIILKQLGNVIYRDVLRNLSRVQQMQAELRLPLVEMAVPALKQLSDNQYRLFSKALITIIKSDGQVDLFEWCLFRLLNQYLDGHFSPTRPVKQNIRKPEEVRDDIAVLISYMARHGHDDEQTASDAFNLSLADGAFGSLGISYQAVDNSLKPLNQSLTRLTALYPHIKGRLIKSLVSCARFDGELKPIERDLIQAIAAIMECPVPAGILASPSQS